MSLHPALWALIFGLAIFGLILLVCLLMGVCVAVAGRKYSDKLQGSYQERVCRLLPGKDCGQCGCETCKAYARTVIFGVGAENACPYAGEDTQQQMLALVKELQSKMEDPTPIKQRKKRSSFKRM